MVNKDLQMQEIGRIVFEEAQERFELCGAKDDFCIQAVGTSNAVFGGTNRVIWNPIKGFYPSRSSCTPRFLGEWDARYVYGK